MSYTRIVVGIVIGFIGLNISLLPRAMEHFVFDNVDVKERDEEHMRLLAYFEKYHLVYLIIGTIIELIAVWMVLF